jgi:hypothetical protein
MYIILKNKTVRPMVYAHFDSSNEMLLEQSKKTRQPTSTQRPVISASQNLNICFSPDQVLIFEEDILPY